jgi:hypothetical protein
MSYLCRYLKTFCNELTDERYAGVGIDFDWHSLEKQLSVKVPSSSNGTCGSEMPSYELSDDWEFYFPRNPSFHSKILS